MFDSRERLHPFTASEISGSLGRMAKDHTPAQLWLRVTSSVTLDGFKTRNTCAPRWSRHQVDKEAHSDGTGECVSIFSKRDASRTSSCTGRAREVLATTRLKWDAWAEDCC